MTIARLMQMARAGAGPAPSGWTDPDLANASYDSVSFSVAGQDGAPSDIAFNNDGSKVYIVGNGNDQVYEYNLSTAWDVSSATFVQNFSVSAQETTPQGLFFKPDGSKMYIVGLSGDDVNEYDLSTAWDISTASFLQAFSVATQEGLPRGLFFRFDGLKMYLSGGNSSVHEYTLSTDWDVSTASHIQSANVSANVNTIASLDFNPDGTKMFVVGILGSDINEYDLSTAWDISTATYLQNFSVASQESFPQGARFKSDGSKMYVVGSGTDTIYQYSTAAAAPAEWTDPDLSNASYDSVSFSVAGQESTPQSVFFKADGTKVYVAGNTGNDINEYDLSTAWDISSATFIQNFSVSAQDVTPQGVVFKPDGLKMYVVGSSVGGMVYEYDLGTAWDISTAVYLQTLDVSSFQSVATGLFLKPDGTKLFTVGRSFDNVNEFSLSTAWDISSASHVQNFSVATQETEPSDLYFSPDGAQMFIIGYSGDDVNEYNLSAAWDISTAVYSENFSVASQETLPLGLFFKPDGSKMYIVGQQTDTIYQYSTA